MEADDRIGDLARELEAYVTSARVRVDPGSRLARMLGRAKRHPKLVGKPSNLSATAYREVCADVAALKPLAEQVLKVRGRPIEAQILPRLGDLAKGVPPTQPSDAWSRQRDLSFEVVVACAASDFAAPVNLAEPDVIAAAAGVRWGIACKSPSGSTDSAAQLVKKGRDQIERERRKGHVDRGLVLLNMTNCVPLDSLFRVLPGSGRSLAAFPSNEAGARHVRAVVGREFDEITRRSGLLERGGATRLVLGVAWAIFGVRESLAAPGHVCAAHYARGQICGEDADDADSAFAHAMMDGLELE